MQSGSWAEFAIAIAVFLLTHSIPVRPRVKAALVEQIGRRGFTLAYSALSVAALAWLIAAAIDAPVVILWHWAPWQNDATFIAMGAACALAALAIGRPNPLSFGGNRNDSFDPASPGIVGWVRHPLLLALLLWSAGHMVPNGTLSLALLFCLFAGFSAMGMRLIDRRKQREFGQAEWRRLASGPRQVRPSLAGLLRLAAGIAAYLLLLSLHGPVIGIEPVF